MAEGCPARVALESFAAGSMAEAERVQVEAHLGQCLSCAEELEKLRPAEHRATINTVAPRWSGLVVTVTSRKLPARLGASIAASGPHDFAVRSKTFAFETLRPSHPAPNVS